MHKTKWLNRIHKKYHTNFKDGTCSFHNLLWQIMVNDSLKGKAVVFYPIVTPEGNEIVIASGDGGYNETGVMFRSSDLDKCSELCENISLLVFHKDLDGTLEDLNDYEKVMSKSMGYV